MRLGVIPESALDRVAFAAGLVPTPLAETLLAMWLARTIIVGAKVGVFEALAEQALTLDEIAERCGTARFGTEKLVNALAGAGYLRFAGGRYALSPKSRKWLSKDTPQSLHDHLLAGFWYWELVEHYEEFVRTGRPLNLHAAMPPETWELYQRAMRSNAGLSASEVASRIPVPRGARDMLDIGGSHGYYSVALCRRYRGLRSTVLDLPEAIERAAPILAQEGMGERVTHRAGNALTEDLGTEAYDLVFMANLAHHFDDATNRELARRVARALRPGGVFTVLEVFRPRSPGVTGQIGALADLFFSVQSESGTWSHEEIAGWQRAAGLAPRRPIELLSAPGQGLQAAKKPA